MIDEKKGFERPTGPVRMNILTILKTLAGR
jgi:hypothetical protein